MNFSLCVYASPASASSHSALQFAEAVIAAGHTLHQVFFYHEGSYHGSCLTSPPQDEPNLIQAWQTLQQQHNLDLMICIAAGLQRGILDGAEAKRYQKTASNLCPEFQLAGLGQLVDALAHSDRLITFGG